MDREVIVVGAGPSGAATATALAQKGHDVMLIDRQAFPRDKVCGDGIPASAIEVLYDLGMEEKVRAAGFYPVDRVLISSPRDYVLEAELNPGKKYGAESYVIPRLHFDALIQGHAIESGAEFCEAQVKEPIIEEGQVVGVKARINGSVEEIRAKVVVGADGVTSTIARALRPDKHVDGHKAVALRAYIDDIEILPHEVEFYLYKGILPGYAWIFPIGEGRANLGLGMRLDKFRKTDRSLEDMVDVFLEIPAVKKRLKNGGILNDVASWQLNFGSQDMKVAYEGAILVGDAAGLINPLTGGGISNGLQSAMLAADVIDEALVKDDFSNAFLHTYESQLKELMKPGMKRSYFIQRSLLYFPIWVDALIRFGGSDTGFAISFIE